MPVVEYYEYELPDTCPLKIENSRFYLEVDNVFIIFIMGRIVIRNDWRVGIINVVYVGRNLFMSITYFFIMNENIQNYRILYVLNQFDYF